MGSVGLTGNAGANIAVVTDGNTRASEMWQIVSPATGAQTVNLRQGAGSSRDYYVQIDALIGVGSAKTPQSISTYGTNRSVTLTTQVNDLVLDVIETDNALTVGGGRTTQYVGASGIPQGGNAGFSSTTATGTSTTMNWTHTAGFTALIAVAFPDQPATTSTPAFGRYGVRGPVR